MPNITPPTHPLPPGGRMPTLNLASSGDFPIANEHNMQSQPDPGKPAPYMPALSGSPELGGIDPAIAIPVLNLAGVEGVPPPTQLITPAPDNTIHQPDFDLPDFTQPQLQPASAGAASIAFDHPAEFTADPMLPDLTEYRHPYGLDIYGPTNHGSALFKPDPLLTDLLAYEVPSGATVCHDPQAPDPLVPDLQQPQMAQNVEMQERPGDLDPGALQQLHIQPLYHQLGGIPYDQVFMNQSGTNSSQRRHNALLMGGLDNT